MPSPSLVKVAPIPDITPVSIPYPAILKLADVVGTRFPVTDIKLDVKATWFAVTLPVILILENWVVPLLVMVRFLPAPASLTLPAILTL